MKGQGMDYQCYGQFYALAVGKRCLPCRRGLLITNSNAAINRLDLLVVLMNPGSSSPNPDIDPPSWLNSPLMPIPLKGLTPTKPDSTQKQLMKVMQPLGLSSALIINLSDIRESDSALFTSKIKGLSYSNIGKQHSLFAPNRQAELGALKALYGDRPVVFGCGVHYKLASLTQLALSQFTDNSVLVNSLINSSSIPSVLKYKSQEVYKVSIN
jgi:hypothetical protein